MDFYIVSDHGLLHPHVHGRFTSLYYPVVIHCLKIAFLLYFNTDGKLELA